MRAASSSEESGSVAEAGIGPVVSWGEERAAVATAMEVDDAAEDGSADSGKSMRILSSGESLELRRRLSVNPISER